MRKGKNNEKSVRLAIIGVGGMGMLCASLYVNCPGLEIVAFCDTAPERADEAAANYKKSVGRDAKVYLNHDDLMRDCSYDAAYIACPPEVQVPIACREMERGVHVMTQVPAALTIDDCFALVHTVKKSGVKYQLAEQMRHLDFINRWREMKDAGGFGKILSVEGRYLHYEPQWDLFIDKETHRLFRTADSRYHNNDRYEKSWRYRLFAEPILYLPHTLSPLLSVTGGRISKVAGFGTKLGGYTLKGFEVCDMQGAVMYNTEDILFTVMAGFTTPHGTNPVVGAHWYHIEGTEAAVELPRSNLDEGKLWTTANGWEKADWNCCPPEADSFKRNITHGGADLEPVLQFVKAIREDIVPEMDVYKAVETAAPAILAAKSCREGGAVQIVPDFRNQ